MFARPFRTLVPAFLVASALAVAAAPVRAEDPPESLLSAESVAYVRFDGFAREREAYDRTITSGLLSREFGPLIDDLTGRILNALGPEALSDQLLEGVEPDQLLKVQVALKQLPHLWEYLDAHGFAAGLEIVDPTAEVPKFQLTFVFPNGGEPEHRSALFGGLRLMGLVGEVEVLEQKHLGRTLLVVDTREEFGVVAWQEGPHVVLTMGTMGPEHTIGLAEGKRENLLTSATFEKLGGFDDYPTINRGFFDVEQVTAVASKAFPPAAEIVDGLGLGGLRNVRFHAGFEGPLVRTTFLLDTPGERKGLLQILSPGGEIDLDDLPPLPVDSAAVAVATIDLAGTYDALLGTIDGTLKAFAPLVKPAIESGLEEMKRVLGVDLRNDVLASLDSPIVVFNAASDGPLNLGMGVAIKVKDGEKLDASLDKIARSVGALVGANVAVARTEYRGVEMRSISTIEEGFPFKPTYTIHDGWFVFGLYPQTIQGFVYRSADEMEAGRTPKQWEPSPVVRAAIDDAMSGRDGAKLTGLYVNDPRPTMQSALSMSPFLVQMVSQFAGGTDFDIGLIPNAQSVTDALHENVTVVVDDGETIRYEGYASLPLPIQLTGMEAYAYLGLFSYLSFAF